MKTGVTVDSSELASIIQFEDMSIPAFELVTKDMHQDKCDEVLAPCLTAMAAKTHRLSLLLVREAMELVQGLAKPHTEELR
eukprot:4722909-Amphidinium_carterae.1